MRLKRPALMIFAAALGGVLVLVSLALAAGLARPARAEGPTVPPALAQEISRVVFERLTTSGEYEAQSLLFDTRIDDVALSWSMEWSIAWMIPLDRSTGADLAVEPGLAILHKEDGEWQASLPLDAAWRDWLAALPPELMSTADKQFWLVMSEASASPAPAVARSGYLLPWAKNVAVSMSRSLGHDKDFPSGSSHFSYDFANGTMFEILAAKDGVVWMTKDSEPNGCDGSSGCSGNYIILKETDATGDYYQLYLHLAQSSIPDELKIGVKVKQGDPVGIADDTGYSTGHHLHFMVHRTSNSYYGTAIDITFDDVPINGGRPRAKIDQPYCDPGDVCNTFQTFYVSGNEPCFECIPPVGGFTAPAEGGVVTATLTLSGYGSDAQSGLRYGQFLAAYNGRWQEVSPQIRSETFSYTWDLCASNVPDGPIALGLRLRDNDHNTAELLGLRIVTKSYICPAQPPACTPAPAEIALFAGSNYTGACDTFPVGAYPNGPSLTTVGADNAESFLLGDLVQTTLFDSVDMAGRGETFFASDANLADNRIKSNWTRSMFVQLRTDPPFVPEPAWPPNGASLSRHDPILLYWENTGAATEFEVRLTVPLTDTLPAATETITVTWQTQTSWSTETLTRTRYTGTYTWQVRGRSPADTSAWSAPVTYVLTNPPASNIYVPIVQSGVSSAAASPLPDSQGAAAEATIYFDDIESSAVKWQTSGLWRRQAGPVPTNAKSGQYFMWAGQTDGSAYFYDAAKVSTLTSGTILVPDAGTYYLTFQSYYETEARTPDWDQRRVQISADGGPFVNVFQMYDDPLRSWMKSPPISLAAYRGQQIRIRFVFDSVDNAPPGDRSNRYRGWLLDDIAITDTAITCTTSPGEPNNDPASATVLVSPAGTVNATICPDRDYDYYVFTAQAGDRLLADIDARTLDPISSLDSVLELLDSDGRSLVALSDDEVRLTKLDSLLNLTLPRTGTYYLRVRSYYPGEGGDAFPYTLRYGWDAEVPQVKWVSPLAPVQLSAGDVVTVSARITETVSGLARVDFLWHDSRWITPTWKTIPGGALVGDVWQVVLDPLTVTGSQSSIDLYIQAVDWAGNAAGAGLRGSNADVFPPQVSLAALAETQTSNSFLVTWNGTDDVSGIDFFELQRQADGGGFTTVLTTTLPGSLLQVVDPDNLYDYRLLAVDNYGNAAPAILRSTFVPAASVLCAAPDAFEPDGLPSQAVLAGQNQLHNFCDPAKTVFAPDEDWVTFEAIPGARYEIRAQPLAGSPAWPVVTLFAADGSTEIATLTDGGAGQPVVYYWMSDRNGTVYARLTSYNPLVFGSGAAYELTIVPRVVVFVPLANR